MTSSKALYKKEDFTGCTLGLWLVLGAGKSSEHWLCRCSCGTETDVSKYNLIKGTSNGCYPCSAKRKLKEGNPSWAGNTGVPGRKWSRMVNNAKLRNIPVEVDFTYVASLFDGTCALTGMEITAQEGSIDRIDSSQGYVTGNIQWVHKDINKMKNDLNEDWFKLLCKLVVDKA